MRGIVRKIGIRTLRLSLSTGTLAVGAAGAYIASSIVKSSTSMDALGLASFFSAIVPMSMAACVGINRRITADFGR